MDDEKARRTLLEILLLRRIPCFLFLLILRAVNKLLVFSIYLVRLSYHYGFPGNKGLANP